MRDEVEFLPADKHKSFLQDGSMTLAVISETDPKYHDDVGGFFKLILSF